MGNYKLSEESVIDVENIYEYGVRRFGLDQAQTYVTELHKLLQTLVDNSNIGHDASEFFPLLKRFVYRSHTIFYLGIDSGVLITRILSQSMDYERHLTSK